MKKTSKFLTAGIISLSMIAPNVAFASNVDVAKNNAGINIELEKRSVILGDKSKISISFKEKQDADSITLNYKCYDMILSTDLKYNSKSNSYEGTINFNKDPEYLNVWEVESIIINNSTSPQTLTTNDLEKIGLNLNDYKITQEYIITNERSIATYMSKTAAPIKKLVGDTRFDTAVKISQEGWQDGANKVILVNGDAIADGITATPLATTYNAPILLCNKDSVPQIVQDELKRLNPQEVTIIGGTSVVSDKVLNDLQTTTGSTINRISGETRFETSLKIAQEIDKDHNIEKIYISNGYKGEVDALTIAAKAGEQKQPIILSEKTEIPQNTYNWLKDQNLQTAYFIGGMDVIDTTIIHRMADITPKHENDPQNSIYNNRVSGKDRHETNANVMKRFYTNEELEAVLVAKSDVLVDALAAGPLAAKFNSPILLNPRTYVSAYHEDNLTSKTANTVYQVGGGINDSVITEIANKLSEHNTGDKTVVLDAGHGGADSGAVYGDLQEKNYTLNTTLATSEYLRSKGINVVLTREQDTTLTLLQRSNISNSIGPDLFTSIHYNSYNQTAKGTEVYYNYRDRNGGPSKTAATNVLNSILEEFAFANRNIKTKTLEDGTTDYLSVLRNTNAPAILVECAFIDNAYDMGLLNTSEKVKTLGNQIGKGIESSLK
ncbi:N-acetylmuramoyl-L-alanine amidase [Romboutsia maritimum]|uniref:N-acetylmuramoyl-L-alanine amidase n=1 Tax=Romboutsia maritimum TaxID=2020948 RepID=A0A371IX12_9FIRM|nr:N-acetylmuramoyl-L-alanine amidase [Romboutsia maritimum]RDY25022.1 N-acetylmuramoyl-L-alanine amidase [Romboutsia maritimum]